MPFRRREERVRLGLFSFANREETAHRASRLVLVTGNEHLAQTAGVTLGLLSRRKANFPHPQPASVWSTIRVPLRTTRLIPTVVPLLNCGQGECAGEDNGNTAKSLQNDRRGRRSGTSSQRSRREQPISLWKRSPESDGILYKKTGHKRERTCPQIKRDSTPGMISREVASRRITPWL